MLVSLIICPSWSLESPPYGIALLKSVLEKNGFKALCFDFNYDLYKRVTDKAEKDSWEAMDKGTCWYSKEYSAMFINKYSLYIESYIDKILGTGSDVIGFTVNQRNRFFTYEIARMIKDKSPRKTIVFGGPSCYRDDIGLRILHESCADAVCTGEGEVSFVNMLKILAEEGRVAGCPGFAVKGKNGEITDYGEGPPAENLDEIPFADYSDFDIQSYESKKLPLLTSKGCIRRCAFCSEHNKMGTFRVRSSENVFSEIIHQTKLYPFIEGFSFVDSLVNGDIKMLERLCDFIIENKLNIRWRGQAAVRKEMTPEFLKKAKLSNCDLLNYGVESGSDKVLRLMKKGYNSVTAERVIRDTAAAGVPLHFNIIIGFPGEGEKEFRETVEFAKRNAQYAEIVALNVCQIMKNSELHNDMAKWRICEGPNGYDWSMPDGSNDYAIRLRRLKVLQQATSGKSSVDVYKEATANLTLGDSYLKTGKIKAALECYQKARDKSRNENMLQVISSKIKTAKDKLENTDI